MQLLSYDYVGFYLLQHKDDNYYFSTAAAIVYSLYFVELLSKIY